MILNSDVLKYYYVISGLKNSLFSFSNESAFSFTCLIAEYSLNNNSVLGLVDSKSLRSIPYSSITFHISSVVNSELTVLPSNHNYNSI